MVVKSMHTMRVFAYLSVLTMMRMFLLYPDYLAQEFHCSHCLAGRVYFFADRVYFSITSGTRHTGREKDTDQHPLVFQLQPNRCLDKTFWNGILLRINLFQTKFDRNWRVIVWQ